MTRKQSKPVVKDVPEVVEVPTHDPTVVIQRPVAHDKKILNLMLQLCDGVQALNGSIYPWKQIREDIVSLMEK